MSLAGKVAFVAGASRGIGATVAKALATEGATVAVAARSEQEGKVPGTIHAVAADITSAGRPCTAGTLRCHQRRVRRKRGSCNGFEVRRY